MFLMGLEIMKIKILSVEITFSVVKNVWYRVVSVTLKSKQCHGTILRMVGDTPNFLVNKKTQIF